MTLLSLAASTCGGCYYASHSTLSCSELPRDMLATLATMRDGETKKKDNWDRHQRPPRSGSRFAKNRCIHNNRQQSSSFKSKQASFVIGEECPASSKKLRNTKFWAGTLVKHVLDLHYRRLIYTELLKNDEDLSTHTLLNAFVDLKPGHFLFTPLEKLREPLSSQGTPASAICFHEEFFSIGTTTEIAICAKLTYKWYLTQWVMQIMHTILCSLNTRVGLNLIYKSLIPLKWNHCIRRRKMPNLQTATQQPFLMEGKIPLHIRFDVLYFQVWLGIVSILAAYMYIGTLSIDRFIFGVFRSERKVVSWHSIR